MLTVGFIRQVKQVYIYFQKQVLTWHPESLNFLTIKLSLSFM